MTRQELQQIYNYENSALENRNMSDVRMLIHFMANARDQLIWIEQTISHNEEADYEELYEEQEQYQDEFDGHRESLKEVMKTKDKTALKEYLGLIQKDADEKFEADKTPMYVSQEKRMEWSVKDFDAFLNKRAEKAEVDCIREARACLHLMEKQEIKSTEKSQA